MKSRLIALLFLLLSACTCVKVKPVTPAEMMDSVVQIHVSIDATAFMKDDDGKEVESQLSSGWTGSGVVYDKDDGVTGPVHSRILSANHVLETPKIGSTENLKVNIFGTEVVIGKLRIDAVHITVTTPAGRTCQVKPLVLGANDFRDVATADVDCDAGRVAKIASVVPRAGDRVIVIGHPLGVPRPLITEGYVSGWMEGYLLTSAPAWPGNSGGPMFFNGEVVGLLVRASQDYPHITLTTPLGEVLKRIAETPQ